MINTSNSKGYFSKRCAFLRTQKIIFRHISNLYAVLFTVIKRHHHTCSQFQLFSISEYGMQSIRDRGGIIIKDIWRTREHLTLKYVETEISVIRGWKNLRSLVRYEFSVIACENLVHIFRCVSSTDILNWLRSPRVYKGEKLRWAKISL